MNVQYINALKMHRQYILKLLYFITLLSDIHSRSFEKSNIFDHPINNLDQNQHIETANHAVATTTLSPLKSFAFNINTKKANNHAIEQFGASYRHSKQLHINTRDRFSAIKFESNHPNNGSAKYTDREYTKLHPGYVEF